MIPAATVRQGLSRLTPVIMLGFISNQGCEPFLQTFSSLSFEWTFSRLSDQGSESTDICLSSRLSGIPLPRMFCIENRRIWFLPIFYLWLVTWPSCPADHGGFFPYNFYINIHHCTFNSNIAQNFMKLCLEVWKLIFWGPPCIKTTISSRFFLRFFQHVEELIFLWTLWSNIAKHIAPPLI